MLIIVQTVLGVLLITFIIIQARGAGLGTIWGGAGESYGTRRGVEKLLFRATIVVTLLFIAVSFVSILLP